MQPHSGKGHLLPGDPERTVDSFPPALRRPDEVYKTC
jgi:hypothetical protein